VFINVYYHVNTNAFILPNDTVTVAGGGTTATIAVDNLTAYLNTDVDSVIGDAPAGASLRVIPASDRSNYQTTTAAANSTYSAGSSFARFNTWDCSIGSATVDFAPSQTGRAY